MYQPLAHLEHAMLPLPGASLPAAHGLHVYLPAWDWKLWGCSKAKCNTTVLMAPFDNNIWGIGMQTVVAAASHIALGAGVV